MNRIRQTFTRTRTDEVGGISAEFIAVMVIVAALIAAVWSMGIHSRVQNCADHGSAHLFQSSEFDPTDCGRPDSADQGGNGGGGSQE